MVTAIAMLKTATTAYIAAATLIGKVTTTSVNDGFAQTPARTAIDGSGRFFSARLCLPDVETFSRFHAGTPSDDIRST